MKQRRRHSGLIILGLVALGLLAGAALTAHPAQAQVAGPYYAEPAWDQILPVETRFVVLTNWGSHAVLDKETGLVWEKSPTRPATPYFLWAAARNHCSSLTIGTRKGWRLPSVHELASLIDPSVTPGTIPTLPPGHPFTTGATGVLPTDYWSATAYVGDPVLKWSVDFHLGIENTLAQSNGAHAWCVRGGMHAVQY